MPRTGNNPPLSHGIRQWLHEKPPEVPVRRNPQHLLLSEPGAFPEFWQAFPLHAEKSHQKMIPDPLLYLQVLPLCLLLLWQR